MVYLCHRQWHPRGRGESSRPTLVPSDRTHYINIARELASAGLAFGRPPRLVGCLAIDCKELALQTIVVPCNYTDSMAYV